MQGVRDDCLERKRAPTAPPTIPPKAAALGCAKWKRIKKGTQNGKQAGEN